MIARTLAPTLLEALEENPAVALLGPRQAGKTTLALEVARPLGALYLDLESQQDLARLSEPELYLSNQRSRLVILDEVQRVPGLFPILRGQIDQARRQNQTRGLYLLLGSASPELLRQSGESLAGRVAYLELAPLSLLEVPPQQIDSLWLRGGFPNSFLASSDASSGRWRQNLIRSYLEHEIPQYGGRLPAETLRRLWTMLAHLQGGMLNLAQLARNVDMNVRSTQNYLDLLVDLFLVRRLPPWHTNLGKRLVKSPKMYIRDTGLLHALLGIGSLHDLLAHPLVGASWEGFVIETLLSQLPPGAQGYFYRSAGGAEIDLVVAWPDQTLWAIEIKRSLNPRPSRGFHEACHHLSPLRRWVVYPGQERFMVAPQTEAINPLEAALTLSQGP